MIPEKALDLSPRLFIVQATEEEARKRDALNHLVWGRLWKDRNDWVALGSMLRQTSHCLSSNKTWLLVIENEKPSDTFINENFRVLASCETFAFESILRIGNQDVSGISYGIASVFVEESLRGNNYALKMLQLLLRNLTEGSLKPVHAFFLHSEIGSTFYNRLGFLEIPSFEWTFPSLIATAYEREDRLIRILGKDEVQLLWNERIFLDNGSEQFAVIPSFEVLEWIWDKELYYYKHYFQGTVRFSCGVSSIRDPSAFLLWTADFSHNCLFIPFMRCSDRATALLLIERAQYRANEFGFPCVIVWEDKVNSSWTSFFEGKGQKQSRKSQKTMLLPIDKRIDPNNWRCIPHCLWL